MFVSGFEVEVDDNVLENSSALSLEKVIKEPSSAVSDRKKFSRSHIRQNTDMGSNKYLTKQKQLQDNYNT